MHLTPIATFHGPQTYPYDAPRQGALAEDNTGTIQLHPHQNYDQALRALDTFSHIWIIYQFHKNENWKPIVTPPRGDQNVGVFASRAPYRPNPIGITCARLIRIDGLTIHIAGHDLLDGTPILDIKPYIPYADSIPHANGGWTDTLEDPWTIHITPTAQAQLDWLTQNGVPNIQPFIHQQLSTDPLNQKKKRLTPLNENEYQLAYRTWRITFTASGNEITIERIASAYTKEDLAEKNDPHNDKHIHREFRVI